jgi:hypothetical protein
LIGRDDNIEACGLSGPYEIPVGDASPASIFDGFDFVLVEKMASAVRHILYLIGRANVW